MSMHSNGSIWGAFRCESTLKRTDGGKWSECEPSKTIKTQQNYCSNSLALMMINFPAYATTNKRHCRQKCVSITAANIVCTPAFLCMAVPCNLHGHVFIMINNRFQSKTVHSTGKTIARKMFNVAQFVCTNVGRAPPDKKTAPLQKHAFSAVLAAPRFTDVFAACSPIVRLHSTRIHICAALNSLALSTYHFIW